MDLKLTDREQKKMFYFCVCAFIDLDIKFLELIVKNVGLSW